MSEKPENISLPAEYFDILRKKETATPLLTQLGYFSRYRENLADCKSCRIAWIRTEGELVEAFGLRRFQDFQQFKNELRWERKRLLRRSVRIIESNEMPL